MSDMFGKIGELLSDEESMKQLTELAQMLMTDTPSDGDTKSENTENGESEGETDNSLFSGFDFGSLMKIQELVGVMGKNDKNTELLLALKPHLKEEKQLKVDKAVKLLKLLTLWNIIRESGLLKDFL